MIQEPWGEILKPYLGERKLELGCGFNRETGPGWVGLDMRPDSPADVIFDLNRVSTAGRSGDGTIKGFSFPTFPYDGRYPTWYEDPLTLAKFFRDHQEWLPFMDESFDTVLSCHVLEHIDRDVLIDLMFECARVLKPGGYFIAIVPHGSHDSAWENPHHRQLFTTSTWAYFDKRIYEIPGNVGSGATQNRRYAYWVQEYMSITPDERHKGKTQEELHAIIERERNVGKEIQVVLRKEKL